MKVTTVSYFIGGIGFVLMGLSIVLASGILSAIVGLIILIVGASLIWAGYRDHKYVKKQEKVNEWKQ
jgi:uncharacterized membrane protein